MGNSLNKADRQWLEGVFEKLQIKLGREVDRLGSMIPYISRNGVYGDLDTPEGIYMWTNGFWAGILWQMHYATEDAVYLAAAKRVEERLDAALYGFEGLYHDVGFMYSLSAVADYRLTGNPGSKIRGLHAATVLAGRYNPTGQYIRAWNQPSWTEEDVSGWLIIDSMMNMPLLYWAGEITGDPRFRDIAERHTDTVLKYGLRGDGSSNHVVVLNPVTGEYLDNPAGQGYASGSAWSRGQSWVLYGFSLAYRHTGKQQYLDAARRSAHYCIANMAVNDWLPAVDFRAPEHPEKYDSTAGMVIASALLELKEHVDVYEQQMYFESAIRILKTCEEAFCNWDAEKDGIVDGGTVLYHGSRDANVPIIYGDYFFVESVLRLLDRHVLLW